MTREAFEKGLAGLGMRRQEDGSYELPEDVEGLHFHTRSASRTRMIWNARFMRLRSSLLLI